MTDQHVRNAVRELRHDAGRLTATLVGAERPPAPTAMRAIVADEIDDDL